MKFPKPAEDPFGDSISVVQDVTTPRSPRTEAEFQRRYRVRRWASDREKCRRCGMLRINVIHEPDPDNAPEGKGYYDAFRDRLHEFVPSGEYAP